MWNDYDMLIEKFRSLTEEYFTGEISLDEMMENFENSREEILRR